MIIDCHCHRFAPGMLEQHPRREPFVSREGLQGINVQLLHRLGKQQRRAANKTAALT